MITKKTLSPANWIDDPREIRITTSKTARLSETQEARRLKSGFAGQRTQADHDETRPTGRDGRSRQTGKKWKYPSIGCKARSLEKCSQNTTTLNDPHKWTRMSWTSWNARLAQFGRSFATSTDHPTAGS
jgi:hypothetical protein